MKTPPLSTPFLFLLFACGGDAPSAIAVEDEPPGDNCEYGGVRIFVGPDENGDGAPDETSSMSYVCSAGATSPASLTNLMPVPPGETCEVGGVRIETGFDVDESGSLEASEVTSSQVVCNGRPADATPSVSGVSSEPEGDNCPAGGVRVDSGTDDNGNGVLDPEEVLESDYVCNGVDGSAMLVRSSVIAASAECETGGLQIDGGRDLNDDGVLQDDEVLTTNYVCNGADVSGTFGSTPIVSSFTGGSPVTAGTTTRTVQSARITVPRSGTVLAIGAADLYCGPTGGPSCATSGVNQGFLGIRREGFSDVETGDHARVFMSVNRTESVTRTNAFNVSAGTHSFFLRGKSGNSTGRVGYWRPSLVLLFIPN